MLVWSYDGLYDDDPVTAFAIWSVLLAWIYAHPMWFFRMIVVILQKWLLIGLDPWGGQNRGEKNENDHPNNCENLRILRKSGCFWEGRVFLKVPLLVIQAQKLNAETARTLC